MDDDNAYLALLSQAMLKAITEANALADVRDIGADFRDCLKHALELYEIAMEELAKLPDASNFALRLAQTYGGKIEAMLALADDSTRH